VLTSEVLSKAQGLLNAGKSAAEVAGEVGVQADTLRKAIHAGRLKKKN
jgi:hypothetical protein